jgi:hypothetical protein
MKLFKYIFIVSMLACGNAYADVYEDNLSRCLSDSTSGKDRKDLARWVFSVMSSHPEITNISPISPENKLKVEQTAGKLYNRLLTVDCKPEIEAAFKNKSPTATKNAFEQLGRLAMMEIMTNPDVITSFSGISKYIDMSKLQFSNNK